MLQREALAVDAAQEALLRAWEKRGARRSDVSWWTWCGGFAIRVCREYRRRHGHPMGRMVSLNSDPAHSIRIEKEFTGSPITRDNKNTVQTEFVRRAVQLLPARQREIAILRYFVGLSTRETADFLCIPEGTVKSNLCKALASLEQKLGEVHPFEGQQS